MNWQILVVLACLGCDDSNVEPDGGVRNDTGAQFDSGTDANTNQDVRSVDTSTDLSTVNDVGPFRDGIPIPERSVIEDDGRDQIVITFDRRIEQTSPEGFTIRGGESLNVLSVSAEANTLRLRLSKPVDYLQNAITWSYDDSIGGVRNLRDLELIHVENLTLKPPISGTEYFVSATGLAANDGLSESSAWSISHAVSQAKAGDKVWIKAGVYDNPKLILPNDGTKDARIVFEGYASLKDGIPQAIRDVSFSPPSNTIIDSTQIPLFLGQGGVGNAFSISARHFITFRNLAFKDYRFGIFANFGNFREDDDPADAVSYCLFEGILGSTIGNGLRGGDGVLIMLGLPLFNAFNTISKSASFDASIVGFHLGGRGSAILDSTSHASRDDVEGAESQDYYFSVKGAENVYLRNVAHKMNDMRHSGHGFAIRGEAPNRTEYNLFEDNRVINIAGAYELRNETTAYNVIRNCIAEVDGEVAGGKTGGIQFSNGAHHNIVEGFSARGTEVGVRFLESTEGPEFSAGHDNLIRNSEFYGLPGLSEKAGTMNFVFHGFSRGGDPENTTFKDNMFINNTFHNFTRLFRIIGPQEAGGIVIENNSFVNCSISNGGFKRRGTIGDEGFSFISSNLFEIIPLGDELDSVIGVNNVTALDPAYVDVAGNDFRLTENSPLIDKGIDSSDVLFDKDGIERPQMGANDIGAYEK